MRDETTSRRRPADLRAPRCTNDLTAAHRAATRCSLFPAKTHPGNKKRQERRRSPPSSVTSQRKFLLVTHRPTDRMQYHSDLSGHCRRSGPAGIADGQQTGPPAADPCKIASAASAWWAVNLIGVKCARVRRKDRAGEQQGGLGDRRAGPRPGARRAPSNFKGHGANTLRGQHSRPHGKTDRDRRHVALAAR